MVRAAKRSLVNEFTLVPRRRTAPLPVQVISAWIKENQPVNSALDLGQLRSKALALLTIALLLRPDDASMLDRELLQLEADGSITITSLGTKTDRSKDGIVRTLAPASDSNVCPVRAALDLSSRLAATSGPTGPLFPCLRTGTRLSSLRIGRLLMEMARGAGLPEHAFTPRCWRAGSATHALCSGLDPHRVRALGGWRSLDTMLVHYDRSAPASAHTDILLGLPR